MSFNFPGESEAYRAARDELLQAEIALRDQIEAVAALRRKLPRGGTPPEDYVFQEATEDGVREVRLSELFGSKSTLMIYSYMYGPQMDQPCVMCTGLLDGLEAQAQHIGQRIAFAVVGRSEPERLRQWATNRGWTDMRLVSSTNNTYNIDYGAESPEGDQISICNVFTKDADGIHHFWGSEMVYAVKDGEPRHTDLLWPLWGAFDLTPEGRGTDWYPRLSYDEAATSTT